MEHLATATKAQGKACGIARYLPNCLKAERERLICEFSAARDECWNAVGLFQAEWEVHCAINVGVMYGKGTAARVIKIRNIVYMAEYHLDRATKEKARASKLSERYAAGDESAAALLCESRNLYWGAMRAFQERCGDYAALTGVSF